MSHPKTLVFSLYSISLITLLSPLKPRHKGKCTCSQFLHLAWLAGVIAKCNIITTSTDCTLCPAFTLSVFMRLFDPVSHGDRTLVPQRSIVHGIWAATLADTCACFVF
ncbi:hypothetical protein F4820DRAFT_412540 [Hypoxylon rubiginosum]|uniref:Uncharacterized protein n=1 Tax=Hypoxylon rubiginosum TaxID=110542 RepID=A0ACB9Z9E9_9PEZI|nr:hypothetical protein F4820DRAFT_412540 [Hypoxylon rubiginosum]